MSVTPALVATAQQAPAVPAMTTTATEFTGSAALTPEVWDAMESARMGRLTVDQRMVLFVNNRAINEARLNGWITDSQYQASQADFKRVNESLAGRAAKDAGGKFNVQVSKKDIFSPGTDSDYIIEIKSKDPVGDVKKMQKLYNDYVNQALEERFGKEVAKTMARNDWHNQLDVDFMVDPKHVTDEQFKQIAELNNDAYTRRLAADYERVSRAPAPEKITDAHVRDYVAEMQDFIKKKQAKLAELRADPAKIKNPAYAAELHRMMAQEQKYIERIESANYNLRKQEGLKIDPPKYGEAHYEVSTNAKGQTIVSYRTDETMAAQGARRAPENLRITATATASSLAPLTAQRAVSDVVHSMVEANLKNRLLPGGRSMAEVGRDLAQMTESLPLSEKGRLIESLRLKHGDGIAKEIVKGYRQEAARNIAPGNPMDNMLKNALSVSDDVRGMSSLRRSLNEFAGKSLKIVEKLGKLGDAMMIKDALVGMHTYWTSIQKALDPKLSDAEANQLFTQAEEAAKSMAESGGMGVLFARVPTLGAMYGAWTLGYTGTRFILENTELGQWIDRQKDAYGDRMLAAYDSAAQSLQEILGITQPPQTRREQLLDYEQRFIKALKEGRVKLPDGVTGLDALLLIRGDDMVGLEELIHGERPKPVVIGGVVSTEMGMLRDTVNPNFARDMKMLGIGGSLGSQDKKLTYTFTLKKYDELLPNFQYDGAASKGAFVTLSWYFTNAKGQAMPNLPPGSPYYKAWEDGEYVLNVTPGTVDNDWGPDGPNPNWSIPFTCNIRVLGATKYVGPPPSVTAEDWNKEIASLNQMTASQAAQTIAKYDWNRRIETLDHMSAQRAAEILWTNNWQDLTATLNRMDADRAAEIIWNYNRTNLAATLDHLTAAKASEVILGNYSWTDRVAALDQMSAKRASEVMWNYNWGTLTATFDRMTARRASEVLASYTRPNMIAALNQMSAKRVSEIVWNYSWTNMIATLDQMSAKRVSAVVWNYDWARLTQTLDHMTAKRVSDVIWNYDWAKLTATLDHMTAKRASDVIWSYDWTKLTQTLDHMTAKRASEVIWNYDWTRLTQTLDHMSVQRAAKVIAQYTPAVRTNVLNHLSATRRSQISKLL